jgi:NitT/TauT family transport system substrate-binding protein
MKRLLLLALLLARPCLADDVVHVGIINSLSDVPIFLAQERGYFRAEGIDLQLTSLDTAGKMIAPLGAGELDVGGGASSAGLFNAVDRGIRIRIVADRTTTWPQSDYQSVIIRRGLVESGRVKGLADLKGLKIGIATPGIAELSVVNEGAKAGGIKFSDINIVYLSFPQQLAALANGALDGSFIIEPFGTIAVQAGSAVRLMNTEKFYPGDQIGLQFFSEEFASNRRPVAVRFMTALLRGYRDYMATIKDGHIAGPGAEPVIEMIVRRYKISEALARAMYSQHVDRDGRVNRASIRRDWEFYRDQGMIKGNIPPEKVVDMSFAEDAVKVLGK